MSYTQKMLHIQYGLETPVEALPSFLLLQPLQRVLKCFGLYRHYSERQIKM